MIYAKSKPEESLTEHINGLLEREKILEELYKEKIEPKVLSKEQIWKVLKIACLYHDMGKVCTPFQNKVLEALHKELIPTKFSYVIPHERISLALVPLETLGLSSQEQKILIQSIYYHHEREVDEVDKEFLKELLKEDIFPRIEEFEKELGISLKKELDIAYLGQVGPTRRMEEEDELYIDYCIVKGLLHRLDHSASGHIKVEEDTQESLEKDVNSFLEKKGYIFNEIQSFAQKHKEKNMVLIGSTGLGKTEMALIWIDKEKGFFMLPIRISINAIFDRIRDKIEYDHVGLLHSTALDYLEEKQEVGCLEEIYQQSKGLYYKLTTCTIDQIFPFVFKYRGYEKIYATLAYSKVVIDEIQAYDPEIVAVILKGLQMITKIGGKFLVMTATLPRIYKEELEKMKINFEYGEFLKKVARHRIQMIDKSILEDTEKIIQLGRKKKVLIIVNTINKAIEMYQKLNKEGNLKVQMLHSRFIVRDRQELEEQIKDFSVGEEFGIWITTQIVEASLDIDFDFLFTEMSTLDSLFQRLGRCYRSRELDMEEVNVTIYCKEVSGIKYVYDSDIHRKSLELLKEFNGEVLQEEKKVQLVDKLYSKEMLKGTEFWKKFQNAKRVLDSIEESKTSKQEAQKMLRKINNIEVIPKIIYDENIGVFEKYDKEANWAEKRKLRREIEKLVTSISENQKYTVGDRLFKTEIEDIFGIDLKYDKQIGLLLEKDSEYEIDTRML